MTWDTLVELAEEAGIVGDEVKQAVQFLHALGSLQYFSNEFLKSRVVISPQWIVDVMSCVVTVHDNAIKVCLVHWGAVKYL